MSITKIEWTDFTLNPVKGKCPVACDYCYALKMYDRFRWNPEIRFVPSVFNTLPKKPCKVFVGSTMELFLFDDWMESILNRCQDFPDHTFQFLTKKPEKLEQWSPFPDNCWVGVTAITNAHLLLAIGQLERIEAKIKYLSIEPMLHELDGFKFAINNSINQVIIGAQTKPYKPPKIEWVEEIAQACDKAGIPIFLKNNLSKAIPFFKEPFKQETMGDDGIKIVGLRQEMPEGR